MSTKIYEKESDGVVFYLTQFYGGHKRGTMLQIGIDNYFIQVTKKEIKDIIDTIKESFDV